MSVVAVYTALLAAFWFALALIALAAIYGAALITHDLIWPTDAPEGDE